VYPLALQLGSLSLNVFGVLVCIVLASGAVLAWQGSRRRGVDEQRALTAFVAASLAALLGAYAGYALGNVWSRSVAEPAFGGVHGSAALAAALGASRLVFRDRCDEWRGWLDAQAPLLALGLCLGQLGCYLLGADYGAPLPPGAPSWLQTLGSYPRWTASATVAALGPGAPAWVDQLAQRLIEPDSARSLPLHPTQLYIGIPSLLLLAAARRALGRHARFGGEGFLLALLAYAALMIVFEPLRDDPRRGTLPVTASAGAWLALGLGGLSVAIVHGPLCALGSVRQRRVLFALLLVLSAGSALIVSRAAASTQRPLALSCVIALALAGYAALSWRRWSERGFDTHTAITSGPHVPPGFTPGGPLQ
jgi:phosphatidylglycerol---prolipoprotein diacylglyceryl transferase